MIWTGAQPAGHAAYNAFDLATLSSAFGEGFPNVVGEAMACGTPVAATDVGDSGVVIDGCGEVVAPRDPALLAEAWLRLRARLAREGEALRQAARARIVDHYSVEGMVRQSEAALLALMR
jgi:glycosyltransferase involved in cell wall biosynthesis